MTTTPGIKQTDLEPCALCSRGVMHTGIPLFYRITLETFGVDGGAVRRQHGLEQVVGNPLLAFHMGPQEDLATHVHEPRRLIVCHGCFLTAHAVEFIGDGE